MALSAAQIKIIEENPLDQAFKDLRVKLRDCADVPQKALADLLGKLLVSPAAFELSPSDGKGDLGTRLLSILRNIQKIEPGALQALARSVSAECPDTDVWAAAIEFVEAVQPSTPPLSRSIKPTFLGTPVKTSSSRLADSENYDIVEAELFQEIKNCTFRDVSGFYDKFFDSKNWHKKHQKMLKGIMTEHNGKKWTGFPSNPYEEPVWNWFRLLEESFLANAEYKLYTTRTAHQFKERKGQLDIFFHQKPAPKNSTFEYKHVLVVGEQKKSYDRGRFKKDLLQITRYVRSVFAEQPTRRFVHAFTLCGSMMELWVFDRSGPYSSGPFDIHEEPDKFARAFVGYATMGETAMGLDTFIVKKHGHLSIKLHGLSDNEPSVRLGTKPIFRQKAIVCRGTTCFGIQNSRVAKFSWTSDKRKPEVEQLRLAEERGVRGLARVVAYRRITTIAELRAGLQYQKAYPFRGKEDKPLVARSTATSSQKRKSSSNNTSYNASRSSKRLQSNSRKSKLAIEFNDQLSTDKAKPSLYTPSEDLWENRIYSCLVVSPAGRVISAFQTTKELLESLQDAIKAHQSLYMTGEILHRDISSNNIIITNPETADGFKGMLIDLDLAKENDSGPSGARHRTGTMQFMAVEVLRKADHTYRHDLESFFYVLLWMCVRESWEKPDFNGGEEPETNRLRKWEIGSFEDIARTKVGDMTVNGLEEIMDEFPYALDVVKPLCLRIRKILFSHDKDGRMNFGTPAGSPNQLYRPIIAAYGEAIGSL
ncbi:hypothetical protein G6O67_006921 [Ophiocordyceps sinensis]|uniref:EKC/KEOPS complex subunit BUD32 n=1 Tax=Ophiocordyceps sinensis TaxID=72228 RepID=A0A8H4LWJ6_9HYPO|nr:hypothetical protein G6O67_006921 [Ophiocordyceps sinensis]